MTKPEFTTPTPNDNKKSVISTPFCVLSTITEKFVVADWLCMFILFVGGAVKVELILLISVSKQPAPKELPVSYADDQLVPLLVTSKLSPGESVMVSLPSIVSEPLVATVTLYTESYLFFII